MIKVVSQSRGTWKDVFVDCYFWFASMGFWTTFVQRVSTYYISQILKVLYHFISNQKKRSPTGKSTYGCTPKRGKKKPSRELLPLKIPRPPLSIYFDTMAFHLPLLTADVYSKKVPKYLLVYFLESRYIRRVKRLRWGPSPRLVRWLQTRVAYNLADSKLPGVVWGDGCLPHYHYFQRKGLSLPRFCRFLVHLILFRLEEVGHHSFPKTLFDFWSAQLQP